MKKHFHMHVGATPNIFKKIGKDPYADWFLILLTSFVISLVFIAFNFSVFLYVNNNDGDISSQSGSVPSAAGTLDKTDLVKVIGEFQDKQARTLQFEAGYQGAPDPSLFPASTTAPASVQKSSVHSPVKSTL